MLDFGSEALSVRASALSTNQDKILKKQLRQRKKPFGAGQFAALIDIDCYQDDPLSIDPRDFIETSRIQVMDRLQKALPPI